MRRIKTQKGYTIVETLIVLAVTGSMLGATILLVSGQIDRYRMRSVAYNNQQSVQDAINDVQAGYFGEVTSSTSVNPSCLDSTLVPAIAGDSQCVYAGKKIELNANGELITTPLVVEDKKSPFIASATVYSGTSTINQLSQSVDYTTPQTFYALFTNYPDTSKSFNGGAQSVKLYKDIKGTSPITNSNQLKMCMKNGNKYAVLVLGENNSNDVALTYGSTCP